MEGQSSHENPVQLMSFAFNGNARDVSHSPGNDPNQHYFMAAGGSQAHPFPLSLPHWIPCQQTSPSFIQLLTESGVSETQSERVSYNNSGMLYSSEHSYPSLDMGDQKVRYLRPHNEVGPMKFTSAEGQIHIQKQESSQDYGNVFQPHLSIAAAAKGLPLKQGRKVSRERATAVDRNRRLRIAEKLDALQELLPPHSKEGCKASVMDDIIDHIKSLQRQIKDLSKSKLAGESTSEPFIFLEGYGHYLFHEEMLGEPLEEILGKLLEMNPPAAFKLLESRHLFMMPAGLAEGFRQTA
ncbi:transcription factor LRL1-like [Cornus florida]|uniref:transcription factor LRL1-like n=1 Tax=Cornus florida TaxID=4283 RepID=UPI0028A0E539|nr:transcription factor LRL1-like [Cornus florida]XP_059660513.1 transcription factor LRL1-like [Cornus florida]XP_059660514.1 transcription factor LRL1-like [Cornus florida]XP_059660515.1 transcription factor LRL1-like [Cornus florida]XP_059660516.1 transcription factor LRL1-like [Cornus florida]XP_059660517.1 transcription factor LRL1-like [Cornus florida]XP_059660518.1 transcription factor LRL1-like [Cornus florida]